jgi:hypothetical protein
MPDGPTGRPSTPPPASSASDPPDPTWTTPCPTALPAAWQAALAAHRVNRPGEIMRVVAAGEDGRQVFAEVGRPGSTHQLVRLDLASGDRVAVASIDGTAQILAADFDGRYLAYSLLSSTTSLDSWVLYLWDSTSPAAPQEISRNATDAAGQAVPGPYNFPIADRGRVFWPRGTLGGGDTINEYDTATGRQRVVHTGHTTLPFRMGSWLVWPESDSPGALTKLRGMSMDTAQPVALPPVMAAIAGPAAIDAGEESLAWVSTDRTDLYVWHTSWQAPRRVLTTTSGFSLDWPHVAGQLVTWTDTRAQFALDLRSGSYTQITPKFGSTHAWGPVLAIQFAPERNDVLAADVTVVDTRTLPPLPRCASSGNR